MWLINVQSYKLRYFQDASQVAEKYAILSHRWEDEEVSHSDMTSRWDRLRLKRMKGWYKIQKCCEQAVKDNLSYAWVDTCCIDKTSSAELQEAINSMFRWYSEAKVCYVFLSDVRIAIGGTTDDCLKDLSVLQSFKKSQWFTRGWTLQELLAPRTATFYDCEWRPLGSRSQHKEIISEITGIESPYLNGFDPAWTLNTHVNIAQVMIWASGRKTTRVEDKAYSLLGIFGVSLPMLYGEGRRAFYRLQEELLRSRDDQSIFAWTAPDENQPMMTPLTDTPDDFVRPPPAYRWMPPTDLERRQPHVVTSEGISVELHMLPIRPGLYHAFLNAFMVNMDLQHLLTATEASDIADDGTVIVMGLAFPLQEVGHDGYAIRVLADNERSLVSYPVSKRASCKLRRVTILNVMKRKEHEEVIKKDPSSFKIHERVLNLWSFSEVGDVVEPPQKWPWPSSETRIVKSEKHSSIVGLLSWNGWPHKLFWVAGRLPITAVAFGYDFDFNPACIVVLGHLSYDEKGSRALQNMFKHVMDDRKDFSINGVQKLSIEGGMYAIIHYGKDEYLRFREHKEYEDLPVLWILKTTPSTRHSGDGFHTTIYLHNSEYHHYYRGEVHIRVSRESKQDPWDLDIEVKSERADIVSKSLMPHQTRFVAPRPAYRLGTWEEDGEHSKSLVDSSSTSIMESD